MNEKKTVAILYGGPSAEHEISIITALQAMNALDTLRYDLIPVYITREGQWYTGEQLLERTFYRSIDAHLQQLQRVVLLPDPTLNGLTLLDTSGNKITDRKRKAVDIYLLAFHGQKGEDGAIQGLLELSNSPYSGCGVLASAVAMDKYVCKQFLKAHHMPVLVDVRVARRRAAADFEKIIEEITSNDTLGPFPLFVKPCHLGSSIAIGIAKDAKSLAGCLANVFRYDSHALVEPFLNDLLEINVSVVDGMPPQASVVEIPIAKEGALTYEDKYIRGGSKSRSLAEGMAGLSRVIDPSDLDPAVKKQVSDYALQAFELLGCGGVVRFDFMFDVKNARLYFNELNPIPGSLSFYLWQKSQPQLLYTHLLDRLIHNAMDRHVEKKCLHTQLPFRAL